MGIERTGKGLLIGVRSILDRIFEGQAFTLLTRVILFQPDHWTASIGAFLNNTNLKVFHTDGRWLKTTPSIPLIHDVLESSPHVVLNIGEWIERIVWIHSSFHSLLLPTRIKLSLVRKSTKGVTMFLGNPMNVLPVSLKFA